MIIYLNYKHEALNILFCLPLPWVISTATNKVRYWLQYSIIFVFSKYKSSCIQCQSTSLHTLFISVWNLDLEDFLQNLTNKNTESSVKFECKTNNEQLFCISIPHAVFVTYWTKIVLYISNSNLIGCLLVYLASLNCRVACFYRIDIYSASLMKMRVCCFMWSLPK